MPNPEGPKPKTAVSSGNPTMKLAATASGRAKPAAKKAAAPAAALEDKNRPAGIEKPAKDPMRVVREQTEDERRRAETDRVRDDVGLAETDHQREGRALDDGQAGENAVHCAPASTRRSRAGGNP